VVKNLVIILAIIGLCVAAYFVFGAYYLRPLPEAAEEPAIPEVNEVSDEEDLVQNSWSWQYTDLEGDETVLAPVGDHFVLSFEDEGRMGSRTDCNSLGGIYSLEGEVLSMGQFVMTKMYCEDSLEAVYAEHLGLVSSFVIEGNTLRLTLNRDYGVMVFNKHQ
jgi:heat shock protein HslJ